MSLTVYRILPVACAGRQNESWTRAIWPITDGRLPEVDFHCAAADWLVRPRSSPSATARMIMSA
ncbi:hypothetical protein N7465_000816 [Penicillium sp. CMV-2018d]|nr:hypothetical protein N7465_000816 [Penicillium sp. CMV-2018d]